MKHCDIVYPGLNLFFTFKSLRSANYLQVHTIQDNEIYDRSLRRHVADFVS